MNKAAMKGWYKVFVSMALLFSTFQINAQNCPTVKRNNGNNAAHTVFASSVINTAYNNVPTSSKEGTITVDFGYAIPSSIVPVIEGVYIGGVRQNVDFGPPSEVNKVGPKYNVEYCFYGNNLAPAHTFTVKFLDPSDGSLWSECTFPSLGGSDASTIDVSSDIKDNSVCTGESITWSVSAAKLDNSYSLGYQWFKDGVAISGKTNSTLTVSSFTASDTGVYHCVAFEYKKKDTAWFHQTVSGTLSLADCSILQLTRIQSPENITISGSNDLSVAFDVEFNRTVNTPATSDFEALLDGSSSRTISSVTANGSNKRYTVIVDISDADEGDLELNVSSSNAISSSTGSLTLGSTTPTVTNNNTFSIGADGINGSVEAAVAGGDRNGDGVPDRNQKNVSTFPWRTKTNFNKGSNAGSGDFVTLSIGDVTNGSSKNLDKNLKISTLGVLETSDSYFDGISFPTSADIGGSTQNVSAIYDPIFFKIEANGNSFAARDLDASTPGTQIRLYFDMPDGGQNFNSYMKWNGVDGEWYEFVADGNLSTYDEGAEFIDLDNDGDYDRIVLTITEGDKEGGDADGSADNIIIDPGTIVSTSGLSYTGALSFEVLEGATPVTTLTTTGATSWAFDGSLANNDNNLFTLNSTTGELSFTVAPDFENPQDAFGTAGDNVHMVRVAISGGGNSTVIDVEVTVLNKWEKDSEGCPNLSDVSPSTGGGTLFDRYAGNYTQYPSLPGQYTGYVVFTFPLNVSEYGIPFIDKIFADGVEMTSDRFDNPRVDDSGNQAYASTGKVQYPYWGNPSQNIFNASILSVYFSDGTVYSSKDQLCSYVMTSPYNAVVFLDVTDNFTSTTSVCGGSGSLSVTVNNASTSTTGPNGGTLEYQWQKDISGTWTDVAGATSASYAVTNSSQDGDYRCVVSELYSGSVYYDSYTSGTTTVTVVNAPSLSAVSATVCEGSSFPLTATTTNNTGETWATSDASIATVTSTGSGAASVTGVTAGSATITYTDGNGCSTTSAITVSASPSAVLDDNAPEVCSNSVTYQLDLSSIIGSPDEYRIDYSSGSLSDIALTSFTGTTLTLNLPTTTAGAYGATLFLKNTTSNCESSAIPFTLNIDALANDGLAVSDATICTGSSATITVTFSESGYSYQLRDDSDDSNVGSAVTGTGGDITFSVSPTATTSYNVYVTNGNCAVELTDKSTVTIDVLSITGLSSVCESSTITLSGSGTSATTNPWTSSDAAVATVDASGVVTGNSAGTATITYTNSNGCSATQTVTVNAVPTISGATTVCVGSTIALTGSGTGASTSTWVSSNPSIATVSSSGVVTGVAEGTSTITYTNSDNCSVTTTITVGSSASTNIAYSSSYYLFYSDEAITAFAPTVTSTNSLGAVSSLAILPALPSGLTFNTTTGSISGTPTSGNARSTYTITGQTACGTVSTTIELEVLECSDLVVSDFSLVGNA